MENASQAAWRIVLTTDTDRPIAAGTVEEEHGQWMCTSLEDVCILNNYATILRFCLV